MKLSLLVFSLLSCSLMNLGCTKPAEAPAMSQSKYKVSAIENVHAINKELSSATFTIEGISCISCETKIKNHLSKNPNITTIAFNDKKHLKAEFKNTEINPEQIKQMIEAIRSM